VTQIGKKSSAFYGKRSFITVYKYPPLVSILSQISPVHTVLTFHLLISILILSSHLDQGLPNRLFLTGYGLNMKHTPVLHFVRLSGQV
jgi:hypothetical protein